MGSAGRWPGAALRASAALEHLVIAGLPGLAAVKASGQDELFLLFPIDRVTVWIGPSLLPRSEGGPRIRPCLALY